jgi:hypothetical protein
MPREVNITELIVVAVVVVALVVLSISEDSKAAGMRDRRLCLRPPDTAAVAPRSLTRHSAGLSNRERCGCSPSVPCYPSAAAETPSPTGEP